MDLLNMIGGDTKNISELLTDEKKLKSFLPLISNLADTFKLEGEDEIVALVSFEDGEPILRVMATKIENEGQENQRLIITRNLVNPADGTPMKFNLIDLLAGKIDGEKEDE